MRPLSVPRSRSYTRERETLEPDSYKDTLNSFIHRKETIRDHTPDRMGGSSWTPRSSQSVSGAASRYGGTKEESRVHQVWAASPRSRGRGFDDYAEDDRNPMPDGRSYSRGNSSRFDDDDDDFDDFMGNARDVLSKMRSDMHSTGGTPNKRGVYSEPRNPRSARAMTTASPGRRRYDTDDDDDAYGYASSSSASKQQQHNVDSLRYEVMGMKEELQHKNEEITQLRHHCEDVTKSKQEELLSLKETYDEQMASTRSKLVETFKSDMQEMKAEWEGAFYNLKEESESTKNALEMELKSTSAAKAEMEGQLSEMNVEFKSRLEEEKRKSKEMVEDLKRSKEEDLERLRAMYEEHIDATKMKQVETENDLKEEINCLLEENEKVKMCYDQLEVEMNHAKRDLEQMSSDYQKAMADNIRFEKEMSRYKDEVEDLLDENKGMKRQCNAMDDEMNHVKDELERVSSSFQRVDAEKTRFEKELDLMTKEKQDALSNYNEVVMKLDNIQEERELESRYTEALVKQRDNMTAIIENSQQEIDELKAISKESENLQEQHQELQKEHSKANERVESLTRERERYNATVKALKVDLQALHQGKVGPETSLQEHMRLLNQTWGDSQSLKSELQKNNRALEEAKKDKEHMTKQYNGKVEKLESDLKEACSTLAKLERTKMEMEDKLVGYEVADSKKTRIQEEMEHNISRLEDRLAYLDKERKDSEAQRKEWEADRRALQSELDKTRAKLNDLEYDAENVDEIKKGMKQKLETAYYDLEEAQREISSMRQDHAQEIQTLESELSEVKALKAKNSTLEDTIESQEEEIQLIKERLSRFKKDQGQVVEEAQIEVAESYKKQIRRMEEKFAEINDIQARNEQMEETLREYKEQLDQHQMAEVKRRGEFAKQRQELEILRSKERHLETHVCQLEEHISKVVSDYESRLQQSGSSIMSSSEAEKALRKQVRDMEKKLEVSSAAMKQLGKSSLLMEKENERLKHDKTELKQKLKKLVDCAEKFSPKK